MTRGRLVRVAAGLVAALAIGAIVGVRGGGAARTPSGAGGQLAPDDRVAIQRVASRFAAAVIAHGDPSAPAPSDPALVTPAFGRELRAHRPSPTAAGSTGSQRLAIESVAVRCGRPPTALVLGILIVTAAGQPPVRAPVTWQLSVADTDRGWRVAAARS